MIYVEGSKNIISIMAIILMMIIERKEIGEIKTINKWLLIYGRRKTGKTFLVEHFLDYDEYFFVKRDRSISSKKDDTQISVDTFQTIFQRALDNQKTVVIDEFHRLGQDFLDLLQYMEKTGKLILISSTLFLSHQLFSKQSPILGFFAEHPLPILSLNDTLHALRSYRLDKKTLVEMGIILREPLTIDFFKEKDQPRSFFTKIMKYNVKTIPALMGEIFIEEDRKISALYEGVLRAIASGKTKSGEISSYLFSRKLLKKDDPSLVQQYLKNLIEVGIIRKIAVYRKNRFVYKHASPLALIFYYADEKYNISERTLVESEITHIINEIMPLIVEDNLRMFLSERFGLHEHIVQEKEYEIDGCLLKFKTPEIALEVKWGKHIDFAHVSENLSKVSAKRKILFVPDKNKINKKLPDIDIVDITDFL